MRYGEMLSTGDTRRGAADRHRGNQTMMERIWMIASALLLVLAAFFVWRNNLSGAFVSAALGACAWFLSYRAQLRAKSADENSEASETVAEDSDED
jgi:hypothetical protein